MGVLPLDDRLPSRERRVLADTVDTIQKRLDETLKDRKVLTFEDLHKATDIAQNICSLRRQVEAFDDVVEQMKTPAYWESD